MVDRRKFNLLRNDILLLPIIDSERSSVKNKTIENK